MSSLTPSLLSLLSLMWLGLASTALLTGCAAASRQPALSVVQSFASREVSVVAHRACWENAPENSLPAIERCIALGVDMVELDVRRTSDNQLVVFHDRELDRTSNLSGRISEYTLAQIQQARLKNRGGGDEPLTEFVPPSLAEALSLTRNRILVNLDVKEPVYDQVMVLIEELQMEQQVLFKMRASPDSAALQSAPFLGRTAFMPIIPQCLRPRRNDAWCVETLADISSAYEDFQPVAFEIVFTNDDFLTSGVSSAHSPANRLWVNTLYPEISGGRDDNDPTQPLDYLWGSLIDAGTRIIQTDRPAALIQYLIQRGLRTS